MPLNVMEDRPQTVRKRRARKATTLAAAALALVTGTSSVVLPSARAAQPTAGTPTSAPAAPASKPIWPARGAATPLPVHINWHACSTPAQRKLGLQCAAVKMPLDYRSPKGATVTVDVARHRATGHRYGSVFVNPGGPGGSAIEAMDIFLAVLGKGITSTYDVVAMDPRGISDDSLLTCWSDKPEPKSSLMGFPSTAAEYPAMARHDSFVREACRETADPVINHMTTGDVARDMDLLRAAVGDRQLTYYGASYGTALGATYAAMFPTRVRALVLDGAVDPVAWTTGHGDARTVPVTARFGSGPGADETMRSAFAACRAAGPKRCPNGDTIAQEWTAVLTRLRRGPAVTTFGPVNYSAYVSIFMSGLYNPQLYPVIMKTIHADYLKLFGKTPARTSGLQISRSPITFGSNYRPAPVEWWQSEKMAGVMCSDAVNPTSEISWQRYADAHKNSWFTPVWTWTSSLCAGWPGSTADAYRGPFTVRPANPVVVVGNTHDPATPIGSARALAAVSPGSRLITVDAFGHTASTQSTCELNAIRTYLMRGIAPANGLQCKADKPIF